ncbi:MAG: mandelate racemase/muconate lactonizing enzyme family protein [Microbacterium sp.]|jgi:L-alanine-DL-glutamate epimerase-like enolase superfamily enzyme|uniref:L-talarate/galactarate dehydratase n=1 Tax=Microbacterium sp. TaxID=51671 RepID=UPI0026144E52|nr:mandelate racemase/muconate lactonizing enzyme family protein [Microbacterium sp.]MDF2561301.1 mandelate racemase/muconate lactonizing enzyme family protein [Microbacterium sp.]
MTTGPGGRGADAVESIELAILSVPLARPMSDAKVLTGRQRPMAEISVLLAEVRTAHGLYGLGFSYSTRAGGPAQYAHALEIAQEVIGQDPSDIGRIGERLRWAGAAAGRAGIAMQAIAAIDIALFDVKARRSGLPLAKLLGAHRDSVRVYNTSGGYLHAPLSEVLDNVDRSIAEGIGGIKIKVGQPDSRADLLRVRAVHERIAGRVPLMVDANQQWDRITALRLGRSLEEFDLSWIEEPIDAHDVEGLAELAARLDTPIASGEMLTSVGDVARLIEHRGADIVQADAPRLGGVSPYLRVAELADQAHLDMAPHFVMELHVHLAAAYPREPWVEHFDWLTPLFDERREIRDGRMLLPAEPGIGLTVSRAARRWVTERVVVR